MTTPDAPQLPTRSERGAARPSSATLRIAGLSALVLFLEMLLVRWMATELRVFAYLQNAVLVAAFLGLGLGFRSARAPVLLLPATAALAFVAFVIRDPWEWNTGEGITQGLVAFQDGAIWNAVMGTSWPQYVRTALVVFSFGCSLALLGAVAVVFRPLGQWLGAWMDAHPHPIAAYTANILGSIVGIALFLLAAAARTPPHLWLVAGAVGLAVCVRWAQDGRAARAVSLVLAITLPLLALPGASTTVWSPYHKLAVVPHDKSFGHGNAMPCGELIEVNGVGYQALIDLEPERMARSPKLYPPKEIRTSHYILPYELLGSRERVLVVGAGSGNDVAAALRAGAQQVVAVEIDPAIVDIGRERHPNKPYSSPLTTLRVDDARAFFRSDDGLYDLIWFGLLDSHTTLSAYANVRLDHFVYTRESFAEMKERLTPSGVVVLFFAPQTDWIADRLIRLMEETFGEAPLAMGVTSSSSCLGWGGLLLVGGSADAMAAARARAAADPELQAKLLPLERFSQGTPVTTDDWPYLYLRRPSIPRYHVLTGAACLLLGWLLRRRLFKAGEPTDGSMMLLGMGFMLLEVSGVSRAALLFGTTWTVNAYVVGAILGMILLANLVASRVSPAGRVWPAAGLLSSLVVLAAVPTAPLAALPLAARIPIGGGLLSLPVFFAGLVFVSSWASRERRDLALGSNLLGSLLGGVVSMVSMAVGFRGLALLTLAVYLAALVCLKFGAGTREAGPLPVSA